MSTLTRKDLNWLFQELDLGKLELHLGDEDLDRVLRDLDSPDLADPELPREIVVSDDSPPHIN